MPEKHSEAQYLAVLVPYQDTLEKFLEKSQEFLREAWEEKQSRTGKEENHWDCEEKYFIDDLEISIKEMQEFKTRRRKEEGTGKGRDVPPSLPPRRRNVEIRLGDEGFFPKEERGAPAIKSKKIIDYIKWAYYHGKINEEDSHGEFVRLIQKLFENKDENPPSKDLITRYVRLWKIHQKDPLDNYSEISMTDWWHLLHFDKSIVKNALLVVLVHPVSNRWYANVCSKFPMKKGVRLCDWEEKEGAKLKKQITDIVYSAYNSEGEVRRNFEKLIKKIFQESNTDEQILRLFKSLLRLSSLPTS